MNLMHEHKLKLLAKEASGKVLDVGYVSQPNEWLSFPDGLDILPPPYDLTHYNKFYKVLPTNKWGIKNIYDTVILGDIIEHTDNPKLLLENCYAALKKGGKLLITTPNAGSITEFVSHILLYFRGKKKLLDTLKEERYVLGEPHVASYHYPQLLRLLKFHGFKNLDYTGVSWQLSTLPFWFRTKITFLSYQILYKGEKC